MAYSDNDIAELVGLSAKFFSAYQAWSEGQIMLLAGTVDDPESFNADGGKDGALGYYPVVNVSGQTVYVACMARLRALALGGANAETLDALLATTIAKLTAVDSASQAAASAAQAATTKIGETEAARAAAQNVVDAGAAILGAKDAAIGARDIAVSAAAKAVETFDTSGRWFHRRQQIAFAVVDRAYRPSTVVFTDGTSRDYSTSRDEIVAARFAAAGITIAPATERLYLLRQQIVTADVSASGKVFRASMLGGAAYPPIAAAIAPTNPTPTPTPTTGIATSLQTGGFVVAATERLYLLRQQIVTADVSANGKVYRASMLGGAAYPPRIASTIAPTPTPTPTAVLSDIVCVGDSLTAAGYGNVLAQLTGRNVATFAIGGQTSRHIAGRMAAVAYRLTVENNRIVDGTNVVTAINGQAFVGMASAPGSNVQFLATGSNNAIYTCKGWLGSIYGTATRVPTGGPPSTGEGMTFVPDAGQILPASCPAGTPFIVDYAYDARTHVIWPGRNNYFDTAQVLSDVRAMVRRIGHSRIVLMPPPNGNYTGERASSATVAGYNAIRAVENAMAEEWPRYFLNIRRLLIDKALPALGITPTAQDLIDIADDTVPASARSDNVHHTNAVRGFIAAEVAAHLSARGI